MKWMQFFTPVKSLDTDQAKNYISDHQAERFTLLDVRQPKEYETAHIPGAVLIPLPDLPNRLEELSAEKPVLVY